MLSQTRRSVYPDASWSFAVERDSNNGQPETGIARCCAVICMVRRTLGDSGLRTDEQKLHQPTGCIINVNEQCAGRTTPPELAMLTAINLDEFSSTDPTRSWLISFESSDRCGKTVARTCHLVRGGRMFSWTVML